MTSAATSIWRARTSPPATSPSAWPTSSRNGARLLRPVAELLGARARLVHQAALGDGEDRHAVVEVACGLGVARRAARPDPGTAGGRLRRGRRGDRHRARLRAELEMAAGEFVEGALVLEEDDLAVRLAAELRAHGELGHRRIADVPSVDIDAARAVRGAKDAAALADRREHAVARAAVEQFRARAARAAEQLDGVVIFVGERRRERRSEQKQEQDRA